MKHAIVTTDKKAEVYFYEADLVAFYEADLTAVGESVEVEVAEEVSETQIIASVRIVDEPEHDELEDDDDVHSVLSSMYSIDGWSMAILSCPIKTPRWVLSLFPKKTHSVYLSNTLYFWLRDCCRLPLK